MKWDDMGTWRRTARSGENTSHSDHGSALLVVMACVAVLFVIGAAVVGAVVFQQAQLSRAAAVSRATQLAQHGMEVYLGAMRRDPQYWNANPRVAGSSTDGTWTATAQPTSSTITAIGHDAESGLLHVIRATVSAKTYSDYTILANETLNLGSSDIHSDITVSGNVRSNSGVETAAGWSSPGMTIDTSSSARVGSEIGFAKATARFPGLFTAASYRNAWVGGSPEQASSLAFYRDPANPTRNYWGSINNLAAEDTTQSADSEPDRVGVGVDLTNGSDPSTGMFYVRAVWPPAVPGATVANRNMMSRQSLINFAQHDPTWDLGTYGDMQPMDPFTQQPVLQDAFTQAYLNPNGNNVLYVGGDYDVYVKGTYSRSMTIVSERNIYIIGDITRASDSPTASLGLVAKNNIYICANMPSTVNAAATYPADGSGFSGLSYLRGSTNPTSRGEVMGQNLTIQAALMAATGSIRMDPASITSTSTMKPARRSGTLTIFGSLAANDGLIGINFANDTNVNYGGFARTRISYDQQLSVTPPPLFPELGDGQVTVRGWYEYTTMIEPNLGDVALGTTLYPRGSGGGSSGGTWTNSDGTTDTLAPTTISNVRASYPGAAVITLRPTDGVGGSGVYVLYCTVDGGTTYQSLDGGMVWTKLDTATGLQVEVSNPLVFQAVAANLSVSHTISFWAVDNAGNVEAKHNATFKMVGPDRTPPVTSVWSPWYPSADHLVPAASAISNNPDYVVWGTFSASFNSADTSGGAGPAEIWVIRDHNPATAISMSGSSGSITIDPPNAGFITHYFEYYAIDKAGNREASKSFTIIQHAADLTAPSTYSDVQASYVGTATISLSAADDPEGMGFRDMFWQLDQGANLGTMHQSTSAETALPLIKPNADGSTIDSYTLTFYSRDLANNQETPVVKTFTVAPASLTNTSPPTTSSDATSTYIGPATINLGATGPNGVSAVYWRLDTGTQQSGTQIRVPSPLSGSDHHTLYFWATDYAGRVEAEKSVSFDVLPDAEHPVTAPYNQSLYSTPTAVFQLVSTANANEKIAKTYYQIDDQPTHETLVSPATAITTTTVSVSGEGTHTVSFRAVDVAGNSEATKTTTLRIDTTPPSSSTNAVANYIGQASIDITATDTNGSGVKATYWVNESDGYVQTFSPILLGTGTWKIDYWSVDKAGNSEATKTLSVTVASDPSGTDSHAPMSYDDIQDYYTSMPAIINLYSWDVESGVKTMFYKLDSAAWVGVSGTLSPPFSYIVPVSGEGEHSISYYAKDVTGNIELSHTKFFTIDDIPPTTVSSVSSGRTYWRPQDVTLSALDNTNGSGIATTSYRLDGGPEVPGTAVHIPASDNGGAQVHTIEFWSVDKAGNREYPSKSVTFTMRPLDAIPPVTNSDAQTMYSGPAWIHLSPMDNFGGSGIAATFYKVDANLPVQGTLIGVLTGGSHTIEYWSVDNAGNVETHNVRTFSIDTAPPTTTTDALAFYQGDATVNLYASDGAGGSGVAYTYYKVDSGPQQTGTAPTTTVTVSGIGPHNIEYWSVDFIGNTETHHTAHLVIDLTPPTTTSDAQDYYTGTATITLSPTDNPGGSGVGTTYYTVDGGGQAIGKVITILPPSSGSKTHTIAFWSVDNVGNVESTNYKNLEVKSAGTYLPVTTSNALAAYTGTATINLTATDIGGPGIKATYYIVDSGAQTTGTAITVSPPASGVASHTIQFWSVDLSGTREATQSASFYINTAPTWVTYNFTGADQYFIVPAGVTTLYSTLNAAAGGSSYTSQIGGTGGQVVATFPVTPAATLTVRVGGQGSIFNWATSAGGWPNGGTGHVYGGGGGGSSSLLAAANVLMEAGAGGGASYYATTNPGGALGTIPGGNKAGGNSATYGGGGGGGWNGGVANASYYYGGLGGTSYSATGTFSYTAGVAANSGNGNITIRFVPTAATGPYGSMSVNNDAAYTNGAAVTVNSAVTNGTSSVTLMSVDPGTGVFGSWIDYRAAYPITLPGSDGLKTVRVQYKDTLSRTITLTDTILLDRIAPITSSDVATSYPYSTTIHLTPTDIAGSGVAGTYYVLDGGPQTAGTSVAVNAPMANSASHTITYWSTDKAGNTETAITKSFTVNGYVYYTGADQYFTVPANVTTIGVTAGGAQGGGDNYQGGGGGYGGLVTAVIPVTPGSTLTLRVGGAGGDGGSDDGGCTTYGGGGGWPNGGTAAGWLGGGGGGSTTLWYGSTELLEAGGGGGGANGNGNAGGYQGSLPGGYQTGAQDTASGGAGGGGWNAGYADGTYGGGGGTSYINVGLGTLTPGATGGHGYMTITYTAQTRPSGTMSVNNGATCTSSTAATLNSAVSNATQMSIDPGSGTYGSNTAYTSTYAFNLPSGDGTKTVRANYSGSTGGVLALSTQILLDSIAPTTTSDVVASYTSTATINLFPTDAGSGVVGTYYKLDSGSTVNGTLLTVGMPSSVPETHTLVYWSVDRAGNTEATRTKQFNIADVAPPTTTSNVKTSYNGTATIALSATDVGTGVKATYYKVDGGAQTTGTVITVNQPASGVATHTISYWSVDSANNTETAHPATFTVSVYQVVPPVTTSDVRGSYTGTATIKLTVSDPAGQGISGTYYIVDGAAQASGTVITVAPPASGTASHTIKYWSVGIGGVKEATNSADFTMNIAPNWVDYYYTGANQFFTVPAGVTSLYTTMTAAAGGSSVWGYAGGNGGQLVAGFPVTPNQVLTVRVGGMGANYNYSTVTGGWPNGGYGHYYGGGGGGSSSLLTTSAVILEAGAGGGAGYPGYSSPAPAAGGNQGTLPGGNAIGGLGTYYNGGGGGGWNGGTVTASYGYYGNGGTSYVATGTGTLTPGVNVANGAIRIRFDPTASTGPYGSMSVNDNATYTKSTAVTVNSAVTNGIGTVTQMCVDPGTGTFGPWVTYTTGYAATLTATEGVKTVRAQYKDLAGNTLTLSDTILLDRTPPTTGSDAVGTYTGNVTIHLTAADTGGSGLQGTYYTVDGGAQQSGLTISIPAPMANAATHTVTYWSTDNAGNIETATTKYLGVNGYVYYTGADQYFTVPANVNLLHITMYGASGGASAYQGFPGGLGGQVILNLPVTPLSTLTLRVGGAGGDDGSQDDGCSVSTWGGGGGWPNGGSATGWLGGGGGGSTSVWLGSSELAEAGGGGGGGATAGGGGGYQGSNPGGYQWGANDWASGGSGGGGWNAGTADGASGGTGGSSFIAYGLGSILQGANSGHGFMLITYTASVGPYGTMAVNNGAVATSRTVASVNSTISDDVSTLSQMAIDPGTGAYGSWISYNASSAITLTGGDGVKTVRAQYRDVASNIATLTDTIILDTTAPSTTSNLVAAYGATATVNLYPTDAGVGVAATYYKIDGGVQQSGTAFVVNPPSSGTATHTVSYWSVDAIGNTEAAHAATFTVTIADILPPITTSDVQPSYNGTATIHLYASDLQSGVKATYYTVDGGATTTGTVITVLAPPSGIVSHTIRYWSVDNAGNTETANVRTFTQTVYDITPPTTTSSFNPTAGAIYAANQPVSLTATDGPNSSGVRTTYYQIDSGTVTTYTATFTVSGDGLHTFSYWSVDYANNTETTHISNQFRIDTIAPVTTCSATSGATYIGAQTFTLTATDAGSGVAGTWWQLDSTAGAWTLGTTPTVPAPSSAVAAHTVYWFSRDVAGNKETTKSVSFNVASQTNTITVTQTTGGTITPGTTAVGYNGSQTFTIAASSGYTISNVIVDGTSKGAISSFLFTNVVAPHTITATFVPIYRITVTQTAGGTIAPGTTDVISGNSQAFTITPLAGWGIVSVTVDGVNKGAITSYTFTGVTGPHTITATYAQYLVTVTQGANGVIAPSSTYVGYGLNQTFSITPNAGYSVVSVTVDGANQGAITSYTFSNVQAAHSITASYTALSYAITVTQSANGTITPGTTVVGYGGTQVFNIAPAAGYAIANVVVDGVSKGSVSTYTFSNVTANHTITATYVPYYTIVVTQGANGTIAPSTVLVTQGSSQAFTITPATGYTISSVTVDGTNQGALSTYTFTNVQAGHTITAAYGDITPPVTTSNFNPASGGVYKAAQTVTLSATDTGSGVKATFYKIDGGTTTTYTAPFSVSGDGLHTFSYWSVDNANVAETMKTSNQFRIDTVAPVTTSSFNPTSSAPFKANQTVTLTALDTNGSGVAITYYKIDSNAYAQYTGAFTISGDGSHSFSWYSVDNAGNSETPHTSNTFILDTVAPVTTCNAVANQIYNGSTTFTLSVSESGSGVSSTRWQLDGGAWNSGASIPVTAPVTGYYPHTINWYSTDGAGNVETTKSVTFKVSVYDVTAPTTVSDAKPAYNGTSTITLTANDGTGSGVANTYYKVDGGNQVAGTSIVTTAPATGIATHTVEFWSVDMVGNTESPHKNATFTVTVQDTWKPTTTCNAKAFYGSTATFQLEATDNAGGSGVANTFYRIDGGVQQTGTVPTTTVTVSGAGTHTVEYWSVDKAGNEETPHGTANLTIDTVAPTTTSNILSSYNGTATISLTATDNAGGSGVYATYYTVDGGAQTTGTVISVGAPASGTVTHTVTYWSVDKVNNAEVSHHPTTFTIKSLPENMSFTVVPADGSTVVLRSVYIAVTAQDLQGQPIVSATVTFDGASVATTLTGSGTTLATASFQGVNLADGVHHVSATFTVANGGSATKDWSFTEKADRLAPVTDSDIQPIYHGTANIHLTPSDGAGGSGIRATYYQVDGKPQTGGVDITVLAPSRDATSHVIVWWSEDNAGNVETPHEAVITVTALDDTTPPTTSSDATAVYPVPGLITLTPRDNLGGWGVANTYYKLDSGARYSGTAVRTGGPGTHTLQFWSTDIAGNIEPTVTVAYTVTAADTMPPTTTSTALPSYIGQAQILLHASDNSNGPVTTYYALDGAAPAVGGTVTVAPPVSGTVTHTLAFWSVDFNGNIESSATPANNVSFTVAAKAVPMTFTNKTPADGAVVLIRNPEVAVTASAAQNLALATVVFDGTSQVATMTWAPGDLTKATASFSTYGLVTGSHSVAVTFIDVFGNTSETTWNFTVNAVADTIKPTTTMVPVSAMSTGPVLVQLSAVDDPAGTGVAHIYTKVDGGGQSSSNPPTTSLTVTGAGAHSVEYWSVDKANQEEVHQWAFFTIDSLAPTTKWLDQRGTIVGTATITLTPTDNTGGTGVAATYSTVDSGTVQSGTTVVIAPPRVGYKQHTIRWWSVDLAGNIEVQKTYTFNEYAVTDNTPPTTTSSIVPTYAAPSAITLTADDNPGGSGVTHTYYILDDGIQIESTLLGTGGQGAHTLRFWSVDLAGNIEATNTIAYYVTGADSTPPVTTSNALTSYAGTATVTLTATDNSGPGGVAHTYYRIDGSTQVEGTSIVIAPPAWGVPAVTHTIEYWSVDFTGNWENPHPSKTFTVVAVTDVTAPVTGHNAAASYIGTATITLTPADEAGGSGVASTYYRIDDGAMTLGTTVTIAPPVAGNVAHSLQIWSVDRAGNPETPQNLTFSVAAGNSSLFGTLNLMTGDSGNLYPGGGAPNNPANPTTSGVNAYFTVAVTYPDAHIVTYTANGFGALTLNGTAVGPLSVPYGAYHIVAYSNNWTGSFASADIVIDATHQTYARTFLLDPGN